MPSFCQPPIFVGYPLRKRTKLPSTQNGPFLPAAYSVMSLTIPGSYLRSCNGIYYFTHSYTLFVSFIRCSRPVYPPLIFLVRRLITSSLTPSSQIFHRLLDLKNQMAVSIA